MKIGCRAHDYGCHTADCLATKLHSAGCNAAQVALSKAIKNIDATMPTKAQLAEISDAFAKNNIEITVLGCYQDLSAPNEVVRHIAVQNVCRCLDYQNALGAVVVGSETSYDHLAPDEKKARLPLMTDSIRHIVEYAHRIDAVFAVEPVDWHPLCGVAEVRALLSEINDPAHLRIIFDPANVLPAEQVKSQSEWWPMWLNEFGPHICAIHIKDFVIDSAGTYCPVPLGQGIMDYTSIATWLHCHPDIPLLREEVIHSCADADYAFMRRLATGSSNL